MVFLAGKSPTVIYGVYIRFWPTLHRMQCCHILCLDAACDAAHESLYGACDAAHKSLDAACDAAHESLDGDAPHLDKLTHALAHKHTRAHTHTHKYTYID
jgi:hypothetical protein